MAREHCRWWTSEFLSFSPKSASGIVYRDFVNTRLLVHKHVKISVDEWILETTRPQKHVKFLEQYIP